MNNHNGPNPNLGNVLTPLHGQSLLLLQNIDKPHHLPPLFLLDCMLPDRDKKTNIEKANFQKKEFVIAILISKESLSVVD